MAATLALSSGVSLTALNKTPASLAYINDSSSQNITRFMLDSNNFIKPNFWMNAVTTVNEPYGPSQTYNATLKFQIPGYDINNLKFYIFNNNDNMAPNLQECSLSSSIADPTPSIYLQNLPSSSYDVHVYNGSLSEENFVAKANFSVQPDGWNNPLTTTGLLNSDGSPISNTNMEYVQPRLLYGNTQYFIALPLSVVPYYSYTVKVVFFATNRPNNEPLNMDKVLYDYVFCHTWGTADYLTFVPDAQFGTDPSTEYEAHFYVDEVKEGNFICKAKGIVNH